MVSLKNFPKQLKKGPFSIKTAGSYGISRYQIYRLAKKGQLERLERGVYRVPVMDINDEDTYRAATLIVGSASAICLLSALSYYNLTDEIPRQTWIMVEKQKRVLHPHIRLVRTNQPKWNIGVEKHKGFNITSVERTIIDCIVGHRYLGKMIGIDVLKRALKEHKTSLNKVIAMASELGKLKPIQNLIEILI